MVEKFLKLLTELEIQQIKYVLIGGYAVVLHGYSRFTEDIDIVLDSSDENIENFKNVLKKLYSDPSIDEITINELIQYPVLRYGTPDGFHIDIIIKLGEAFNYDNIEYELIEVNGANVKVADAESLFKMKKDTMRPSDEMDVLYLKEIIRKKNS
ncbi:MAG: hypothetical protein HW421_1096 [Ignavibacteria bacterium]|nr:hypothetical protein [Ignavibacteria bacterium]